MANYKTYKLGNFADVQTGPFGSQLHASDYVEAGIPSIMPVNIVDHKVVEGGIARITHKDAARLSRYLVATGDIVFSRRGEIHRRALITGKENGWLCGTGCLRARLRSPDEVDPLFLYFYIGIDEVRDWLYGHAVGTSMPNLNSGILSNLPVALPDLPTQRRIAEILSALDDKIELNRRMNQTLEQLAQRLFEKYSDVDEFVPLTDLVELNPRLTLRKGTVSQYVEMSNLSETSASIKQSVLREYSGGAKFQNNDTLLARITPCLENGKSGFVDILEGNEVGFGSTEYIVMRAKQSISPYFVYCVARDKAFREHAMRSMTGTSGRQRVQVDMLETFSLPKWSAESMDAFHTSAHAAFQKIRANTAEINTLTQLRDTLLPKLMSGEIDVMQSKLTEQHEPVLS